MSDQDDPFAAFGSDRTVIRPSGGRAAAGTQAGSGGADAAAGGMSKPNAAGHTHGAPLAIDALTQASMNPLVAAAVPLLVAAPRIRQMARHPNPSGLRDALVDGVKQFESHARQAGLPNEQVVAARYILCTFVDESAASTPWGGAGAWSARSLLVQFHNETWGGEKVFQLLSRLAQDPASNRNLLELQYTVLALGFEGRYRVQDNGRTELNSVRQRLAQILQQGQHPDTALSPRWKSELPRHVTSRRGLPMWLIGLGVAVLLGLVYSGLRLSLDDRAEPVFAALSALDAPAAQLASTVVAAPVAPRLANLLKPQIDGGLLQVQDLPDRSVVILRGDSFFDPGSDEISSVVGTVIPAIAQALSKLPGKVLITGHSDNQPIHTIRFPSNWHLSKARAEAVREQLATVLPAERLTAQGSGDSVPVADNSTPAGRARNRRVEITLFVQPTH